MESMSSHFYQLARVVGFAEVLWPHRKRVRRSGGAFIEVIWNILSNSESGKREIDGKRGPRERKKRERENRARHVP